MNDVRPVGAHRRLIGAGVNLTLVAALLLALTFLAPSLLGYERYVITGGSMSGSIEKGSVVFERAVAVDSLEVGDVITYLPPPDSGVQTLVTHRIISITRDESGRAVLRTQGDANADPDPWKFSLVEDEQPVVEYVVPYAGHALIALADPDVRRLVIGAPAGVVALIALGQLASALRPRRREVPNCGGPVEVVGISSDLPIPTVERELVSAGSHHFPDSP